MRLKLALAQIATRLGDVESNLEKHLHYIHQAKSQKADLIVFPELSLTGYVLQDLVATVAHRPTEDDPVFKHLLKASHDLDLVATVCERGVLLEHGRVIMDGPVADVISRLRGN